MVVVLNLSRQMGDTRYGVGWSGYHPRVGFENDYLSED